MTEPYMLRAGYYHNYTGICKDKEENLTTNEVVDLLNALHEENIQLKGEVAHYKLLLMSLEKEAKRLSQIR